MYFSTAVALAALPFLVGASPVQNSLRDLISIPLSKRSTFKNADGVANTASLKANIHRSVAKIHQGFKRFEINTGQTHPLAPKEGKGHIRRDAVPLTDVKKDFMWTGEIAVGTPPKTFTVEFDTGSSDLFLPGNSCTGCEGHQIYNHSESSTSKNLQMAPTTLIYGDGDIRVNSFADNVHVGGFEAPHQTLGVASMMGPHYSAKLFGADGMLGLGFKEISGLKAKPVFETLVDEHKIKESVFGVVLAEAGSELILGGTDTSRFKGGLTYLPVDIPGYWQIKLEGITVDKTEIKVENKAVVIDTGTSLIIGDPDEIKEIYKHIPGSAPLPFTNSTLWEIPCNSTTNIRINFGGVKFNISPKTYVFTRLPDSNEMCIGGFTMPPPSREKLGFWVIGDVFLQNVYTEFDFGKQRVGFAALA